jgi:glycosyltransferase involved in cell wall biosynthesis
MQKTQPQPPVQQIKLEQENRNKMHILLIHQCYRQPGGEERIVAQQQCALRHAGHHVSLWLEPAVPTLPTALWQRVWQQLRLPIRVCWSRRSRSQLRERVLSAQQGGHPIDIIHIHNTFPGLSLSIVHQAKQLGVPVVMTLHNARWLTPSAVARWDGGIPTPWQAWWHKCYRDSRVATTVVQVNSLLHRYLQSLESCDAIICPSQFLAVLYHKHWSRRLPIRVIPHASDLVADRETASTTEVFSTGRAGALFAGRADVDKGLPWLLAHWPYALMPLTVAAPVNEALKAAYPQARFCDWLTPADLATLMATMDLVVVPSQIGESFGNTALEALALSVPVLAANAGALPELVQHGHNGLLFHTMDSVDLQIKVQQFVDTPQLQSHLRQQAARSVQHLSVQQHMHLLTQLYRDLCDNKAGVNNA